MTAHPEERLEFTELELPFKRDGRELFFNHIDKAIVWPNRRIGIVIDYKMLWLGAPAPAVNKQIRCYSLVLADHFGLEYVYGAIFQPRVSREIHPTLYGHTELVAARAEIEAAWDESHKPNAPRLPSMDACRNCKGFTLGVCREARENSLQTTAPAGIETAPEIVLANMPPAQRSRFFEALDMAARLKKTFTEAAKPLVARDPEFIPGWKLFPGGERETVTDPLTLFNRLTGLGVTAAEFIDICSTRTGKLQALVKSKTGLKGKSLQLVIDELLIGVVDRTPIKPSLEKAQ